MAAEVDILAISSKVSYDNSVKVATFYLDVGVGMITMVIWVSFISAYEYYVHVKWE